MNLSGAAWEWIAMPFFALLHSDRGLFLINAVGFLLMPSLMFSIFRQLGVARKVAWTWMWILPLAYGYVTQAGSIGNDLTGAIFSLLSVYFGLRARQSQNIKDLWLAILAGALMTGVKLSNLPLALPCLVAAWPALGLARKYLLNTLLVVSIAGLISVLPIMMLNQLNTGNWTGDAKNQSKMQIKNPVVGCLGNSILLAEQSFTPPILLGVSKVNDWVTRSTPHFLTEQFPRLRSNKMNELPSEEAAGLGLTTLLPFMLAAGASLFQPFCFRREKKWLFILPPVVWAAWVAVLFFMCKMGSEAGPRLMLPYYLLALIPFLRLPMLRYWLSLRTWRVFLALMALGALPAIVLSPSRPLWPAQTVSEHLAKVHPQNKLAQRIAAIYTTYANRNDILAPLRRALPAEAREIGFIAGSNDTSYSLWRPFGQRQVKDLGPDIRQFLQAPNFEWVVVKQDHWSENSSIPLEEWAQAHHAKIVLTLPITELVSWGAENWCVVNIEMPANLEMSASH